MFKQNHIVGKKSLRFQHYGYNLFHALLSNICFSKQESFNIVYIQVSHVKYHYYHS